MLLLVPAAALKTIGMKPAPERALKVWPYAKSEWVGPRSLGQADSSPGRRLPCITMPQEFIHLQPVDYLILAVYFIFVLGFGYWCTDFLVVQRAMAAESMSAARRTPLIAAIPKMLFPALVIVPGMIAISLHHSSPERWNC